MLNFYFCSSQNSQEKPQVKDLRLLINDISKELVRGPQTGFPVLFSPCLNPQDTLHFLCVPLMLAYTTYRHSQLFSCIQQIASYIGWGTTEQGLESSKSKAEDWTGWAGAEADEEKDNIVKKKKPRGPGTGPTFHREKEQSQTSGRGKWM